MSLSPVGMTIDLIDELFDARSAITDHMSRLSQGGCHQAVIDHQQSVVKADQVSFDHDPSTDLSGFIERFDQLLHS